MTPRLGSEPEGIVLRGERVTLRPFRLEEQAAVQRERDKVGPEAMPADARGLDKLRTMLERSGRLSRGRLDLAIEVGGRAIGEIQARGRPSQALPPGVFELGIMIWDASDRGRGFGAESITLLTDWLFGEQGAGRVQLSTDVGNVAMRRSVERIGFPLEGTLRGFLAGSGGTRVDCALYAITPDVWAKRQ
jgi:RimJ/RimL family protein N-acetyltransferase